MPRISELLDKDELISISAESSKAFLDAVFDCYEEERLFLVSRDQISPRIFGLESKNWPLGKSKSKWFERPLRMKSSDKPAQIVFSSGTEGAKKAVLLSYNNLGDVVVRLNDLMVLTSEIREYVGVPVTYSFGLGRVRAVAAA